MPGGKNEVTQGLRTTARKQSRHGSGRRREDLYALATRTVVDCRSEPRFITQRHAGSGKSCVSWVEETLGQPWSRRGAEHRACPTQGAGLDAQICRAG